MTAIREIKILNSLRHENIVSLIEIMISNDSDGSSSVTHDIVCDFIVEATDGTPVRFDRGSVFMVFEYCDFDLTGLMESGVVRYFSPAMAC